MKYLCCIVLVSICTLSYGQYSNYQTDYSFQTRPNGTLTQLTPAPKEKIASAYLYNEFYRADIYYKDSTKTTDATVKLDLMQNVIDIPVNNEVRVLPVNRVMALLLKKNNGVNELYVNSSTLPAPSGQRKQLYQVLRQGVVSLYSKPIYTVVEASTNPALALNHEPEVVLKRRYIIVYKDNFIEVDNKSKLKEDVIKVFGPEVEPYLKKVNTKRETDLALLVEKLNDLKGQASAESIEGVVN